MLSSTTTVAVQVQGASHRWCYLQQRRMTMTTTKTNDTAPMSSLASHCLRGGSSVLSSGPPTRHHHNHRHRLNQNNTHNDNDDRLWRVNDGLGHADSGIKLQVSIFIIHFATDILFYCVHRFSFLLQPLHTTKPGPNRDDGRHTAQHQPHEHLLVGWDDTANARAYDNGQCQRQQRTTPTPTKDNANANNGQRQRQSQCPR